MSRRVRGALAVLLLVVAWLGLRQLGAGQVRAAAAAVEAEQWDEAVTALSTPSGLPPSATALHDLGVVHYRRGDLPRALAAWRAARELAPRDGDLVHDLALARSELPPGVPEPVGPVHAWMELVTPGEVGVLALLAWLATSVAAHAWRRRGQPLAPALGGLGVAVLLTVVALQGRDARLTRPPGVALEEVLVRDAPSVDAGERFVLPAGTELRAEASRGPFLLVLDGKGRRGWVVADAVDLPDPGSLRAR
ncbi:MAG: SH3 domain-containing protein [Alphaproteobacteria bacterium]|nr:SH3 domain-containing protein [Alphaproteobacteria bacterium]